MVASLASEPRLVSRYIILKLIANGGNRQSDSHLRIGDRDINRTFFPILEILNLESAQV